MGVSFHPQKHAAQAVEGGLLAYIGMCRGNTEPNIVTSDAIHVHWRIEGGG